MKILIVTNRSCYHNSAFGGAEISMKLIGEYLLKNSHEIFYITKRFDLKLFLGSILEILNSIKVYSVNYCDFYKSKKSKNSYFISTLQNLINQYQSYVFSKLLDSIIVKNKIQIVYCFYELNIINKLIDVKKKSDTFKIVMRLAGNHWYEQCRINPSLIRSYEVAFNAVDSFNFLHSGMMDDFRNKLQELDIKVQIRHFFFGDIGSASQIGRPAPYHCNQSNFDMIMAARFSNYQKRQDIIVQAMAQIPRDIPVRLFLIGEGTQKESICQLIERLDLQDRVTVEPFCEQSLLWNRLLNAQLLCHACDYEGVSKIIVESQSIGLPVLASDVAPLNEYIQDGVNGFLVDNDPRAWAEKIIKLYQNQAVLSHVSESSMEGIRQKYDPKNNISLYERAFEEIIASQENHI